MNLKILLVSLSVAASGCAAAIDVTTDPISADIPFQSVAVPAYSEIAIAIPEEAQTTPESVVINSLTMTGNIVNPMKATSLEMALKLSFEGVAQPGSAAVFQHPVKPLYYDAAETLLESRTYAANTTFTFTIPKEPLLQILGKKTIYILINNTVTQLGLGDTTPGLKLQNVQVHAQIVKEFPGLGPGTEVIGL